MKIDNPHERLPTKLNSLVVSRGVGAILIMLFHASAIMNLEKYYSILPLNGLFKFGSGRVDFFFVLSGFIIMYAHKNDIGKKGALVDFIRNRCIRIYPFYWIVSAIVILSLLLIPSLRNDTHNFLYIIKSLLLIPQKTMPLVIVAWTLTHEILFYIIFGSIIFLPKIGFTIMFIWFSGIVVSSIFNLQYNYLYSFIFNFHNIEFFFGIFIALNCKLYKNNLLTYAITITGIFTLIFTMIIESYNSEFNNDLMLLCYATSSSIIIFGLVTTDLSRNVKYPEWLLFLGRSSYSIYLIHFLTLSFFIKILIKFDVARFFSINIIFFILITIATITGIIFHVFIEKPLLKLMRKNRNKITTTSTI